MRNFLTWHDCPVPGQPWNLYVSLLQQGIHKTRLVDLTPIQLWYTWRKGQNKESSKNMLIKSISHNTIHLHIGKINCRVVKFSCSTNCDLFSIQENISTKQKINIRWYRLGGRLRRSRQLGWTLKNSCHLALVSLWNRGTSSGCSLCIRTKKHKSEHGI